jgi:transcriptional regulator GlxA family with amidase domain
MTLTLGIILFDGVEELDFAGPWEVLRYAEVSCGADLRVGTVAENAGPVTCSKGLRVLPDFTFEDAPPLDIILVPGGQGTRRERHNPEMLSFLRRQGAAARWVTSVCTGVLVLLAAGLAEGRRVTTHWDAFGELDAQDGEVEAVPGARYVRDGNLVTSAGVSAGIDMSLWLLGELFTPDLARAVKKGIEYEPDPPYGETG